MTEQTEPPAPRIGDAERDEATRMLSEHLAAGRLTQDEFDERMGRALQARTSAELRPLFADLPNPRPLSSPGTFAEPAQGFTPPAAEVAVPPVPGTVVKRGNTAWAVASAVAWPAAIIFCFATDWRFWWVMLIPVFFPWWLRGEGAPDRGRHRDRRRYRA